jgi:NAD(P)H-nitrite reductase large subunit
MSKETVVCRCEDVTRQEIISAVRSGLTTIEELKHMLRCTAGQCQGKTCGLLVAQILSQETGTPISEILQPTTRPPLKPIPMKATLERDP